MTQTAAPAPDPTAADRKTGPTVAVLALSGVVVSLMQTLVIPIIPRLPEYLHADAADTAWVITATLLAAAVATPVMGRLGDMFGKRRLLLISILLMTVGSLVGALSSSLLPMLVGRILQGLSAGVIPLGISILKDTLPRGKLAGAIATMSASLGVGGALGLPIAAIIVEIGNWHMLFWVATVLGALSGGLVLWLVPESPLRAPGGFDFGGAITLSIALVSLLLAVSKGAQWGWTSAATISGFVIAAIFLTIWVTWELRSSHPLVDLRVSVKRQVLLTNAASVVFGFAMFSASLVYPQVIQLPEASGYGLGASILVAGLAMAPFGLMLLLAAPISARITTLYGAKTTLILGAIIVALGYLLGAYTMHSIWQIIVSGVIIGLGIGFAYGSIPALIMAVVPADQTGAANSFNALMRSLGTSFASAIAGLVLAQMTISLGGVSIPSAGAFKTVMLLAAGSAVIAAITAQFIPKATHPVTIHQGV